MDSDEESAALYHQQELEYQEQDELDTLIKKLEALNERQNERFRNILQEKDKCYLQRKQAKISR